ncbi:MAG: 2,3,4,5-tetrahydropyridine-2,6-dicarboxylate N-succinyltransferase [Candidatus Cloacimonetes bacterium]|nr:2,3,4,5-tetrahydropyridine-2,6-dicarboxylate N-succinyltransferase [Candidatus Cloacimonadota bacterium]
MLELEQEIKRIWEKETFNANDREIFQRFLNALTRGEIRAAEKIGERWQVNVWVKKGILIGFKMGVMTEMPLSEYKSFFDKDTFPERKLELADGIRMVCGGSAIRQGAYVAPGVVLMPPMYINVGAYVDEGTMIDSHALVGSCAQVGKNVHISAASQIGGVMEPVHANPVIIEDNVFIGGNCGIYEGVIISANAIVAAGVIITASTPVYDAINEHTIRGSDSSPLIVPENAVVIPGSRPLKANPNYSIYCPIITKYRDEKSDVAITLELALR